MTVSPHALDAAVALTPAGEHRFTGQTHPTYANMVGPFGGTIAATLLNGALSHPERLGEPLSLTVHYAAPIADGAFEVHARPMRTNRSTQHWLVELRQDDAVAAFATVMTAMRRDTWSATDAVFPSVPPAAQLPRHPGVFRTAWPKAYDMRFTDGEQVLDSVERDDAVTQVWIRDEPPRPLDFLSLSAICDAFIPRIFVRRSRPVPAGTVTLTVYFHADAALLVAQGSEHVLGCAKGLRYSQGFHDQTAEIWSARGDLLAVGHQVVYFKE